jgi:replication factor C large subunit
MADWTEKYRPETLDELRGNDSAVEEFAEWARSWPEAGRAVVLSGSPGVGKTSAAHALAGDLGWEVVEVNASDSRKEQDVRQLIGGAATNQALDKAVERAERESNSGGDADRGADGDGDDPSGRDVEPQLLIIDEADNFHGNADRGGARALSDIVREAGQPMVLIVNDEYEMPDSLRNRLDIIEFRDVSKRSILPVLRDLCRREDVEYEDDALEAVAEKNSGDLRGAVNDLQALAEADRRLTADDVVTGDRDRTTDIFSFLDAVIKEEDAEGALRASYAVEETPDDLINWIEDNVPKDYAGEELAVAYDFLATADKWLGRVRATQNYSYWRYAGDAMTAGVAAARSGPKGGWTRYGPPSYWSKLGRSRGTRDTRDYVAREVARRDGTSVAAARREVVPFLAAMTHHCRNRELTVAMAAAYDLDAEHVSFVTGSGEDTNKVASIVADAAELREEAAVEASEGAFAGGTAVTEDASTPEADTTEDGESVDSGETADTGEAAAEESQQTGLSDFG